MKRILHENQSPMQEIRNETTAKNVFNGHGNEQLQKSQLPEEKMGERTTKVMGNGTAWE